MSLFQSLFGAHREAGTQVLPSEGRYRGRLVLLHDGQESEKLGGNTMSTNPQDGSQPTVVLLHGAWADGSSWNDVIERLQAQGVHVTPPNPLRGISIDSAYIGSFLEQIPGPCFPSPTPMAVRL